ncbi:MAG: ribosomal protein L7/L12 [Clostridia bacterium]|nr:ribosomal protein L7/L12 [Clostridia bacterium]
MAVFKCKMCGGALNVENSTTITCDYCGSQQTLPRLNDDMIERLYDRANHFRRNNEFDKAMGIYEEILNENIEDAESYWSIVLCKYGIEYVEDPLTKKRIPTVNRAQYTSIFDDDNYKSAIKYADISQKLIYEEEARAINEIQKGILDISQKEEPFDVFICYKETDENGRRTHDSVYATELYHELKREGFKVFFARITLEDKLGVAYEPYIFAALNSAKVMVVLGTKPEFFNAVWVKNEWSRYLSLIKNGARKVLIPAYKDMDPYDLPQEFSHLQAQDMSKLGFMPDLIRGIKKIIGKKNEQRVQAPIQAQAAPTAIQAPAANTEALLKRVYLFLESEDWSSADEYAEKVLDNDPENGRAYLGKLLAQLKCTKESDLVYCTTVFENYAAYKNAIRFLDDETATRIIGYNTQIKETLEKLEAERRERERQIRENAELEAQRQSELQALYNARQNASNRIGEFLKQKKDLEEAAERARHGQFNKKNAIKLNVVAGVHLIITIAYIFTLLSGFINLVSTGGDGSHVGSVVTMIVVRTISGIVLLAMIKRAGLIPADMLLTGGLVSHIQAIKTLVRYRPGNIGKQSEAVHEIENDIMAVQANIDTARSAIAQINQKINFMQNEGENTGTYEAVSDGEEEACVEDSDSEEGKYSVVLQSGGLNQLAVMNSIKEMFEVDLRTAKDMIDAAPCVIAELDTLEEANYVLNELREAGAEAYIQ